MAELLLRVPFLPGESDLGQLSKIFEVFGTPTEELWPNVEKLSDYVKFKPLPAQQLKDIFSAAGDDLILVMESCFRLDPSRRCTCTEALKMDYFSNYPPPTTAQNLPLPRSKKVIEDEIGRELMAARKRVTDDTLDGSVVVKRLQF